MIDFTLSITQKSAGFVVTTADGGRVVLGDPGLALQAGRDLYAWLFRGQVLERYQAGEWDRLLLYVSTELLDWPWQSLHDGEWLLALRHPIVLLPVECLQRPAPTLELRNKPLRILLTLAPNEEYAALGNALAQMLEQLEERHADRVRVRQVRLKGGPRQLREVFRGVLEPFHLWQHVGPCEPTLALRVGDALLEAHHLNRLLDDGQGLHCFVLSTLGNTPAISACSQLKIPFLLCQAARPDMLADRQLLQGFYTRLLTHDLALAVNRAQQTASLDDPSVEGQVKITMLAQTPQLYLGMPQPVPLLLPEPIAQAPARNAQEQVRLLFLKANPRGAPKQDGLRIDQEIKVVKSVLRENQQDASLHVEVAVRLKDLSPALQRHRPALLHFSGHATGDGALALEKYATRSELYSGTQASTGVVAEADFIDFAIIARLFMEYHATLRCVVLNACYSDTLAEAVCQRIACAIGMRGPINDGLALLFSEIFYRALGGGESVGQAFREARNEVLSYSNARAETFQIRSRAGSNPDELFLVSSRGGRG